MQDYAELEAAMDEVFNQVISSSNAPDSILYMSEGQWYQVEKVRFNWATPQGLQKLFPHLKMFNSSHHSSTG